MGADTREVLAHPTDTRTRPLDNVPKKHKGRLPASGNGLLAGTRQLQLAGITDLALGRSLMRPSQLRRPGADSKMALPSGMAPK